jgi:hypothetical protein
MSDSRTSHDAPSWIDTHNRDTEVAPALDIISDEEADTITVVPCHSESENVPTAWLTVDADLLVDLVDVR